MTRWQTFWLGLTRLAEIIKSSLFVQYVAPFASVIVVTWFLFLAATHLFDGATSDWWLERHPGQEFAGDVGGVAANCIKTHPDYDVEILQPHPPGL